MTGLDGVVMALQGAGHRVVLAHPERCPALHREPRIVESLVRGGVLTSITAGSLVGRFGGEVRRFARHLLEQGLVHNVASDAHDATRRPPGMAAELEEAGFAKLADWLTGRCRPRSSAARRSRPARDAARARRTQASGGTADRRSRGCAGVIERSGELRDRDDHADHDEHDDRALQPDPGG